MSKFSKRSWKLIALFLVIAVSAVLVGGCGGNQASNSPSGGSDKKKPVIGISMSTLSFPWQKFLTDTSVKEIEKMGGQPIVLDAQGKVDKQTSDIEDLITKKVDVILLNAIDGKAVAPAVKEANQAGIPVIATARRVEGADMTQFVACDNVKGGELAAKIIADKIKGQGKVALIEGTPGSSSTTDRTEGFKQGVAKNAGMQLVYQRPGNYKRDLALNLTEDLLQAHPDIAGIFYENDDMAIGGLQAIEAAGKLHKIVVVGYDGIKEGLENIKSGRLDATVYNDAISIAQISVDSAFKVIRGEKVDSFVSPPMPVITKDNVDQFLKIYQQAK